MQPEYFDKWSTIIDILSETVPTVYLRKRLRDGVSVIYSWWNAQEGIKATLLIKM